MSRIDKNYFYHNEPLFFASELQKSNFEIILNFGTSSEKVSCQILDKFASISLKWSRIWIKNPNFLVGSAKVWHSH